MLSRSILLVVVLQSLAASAWAQSTSVKYQFKADPKNSVNCLAYDGYFANEFTVVTENGHRRLYGRRGFLLSDTTSSQEGEIPLALGLEHFTITVSEKSTPKQIVVSQRAIGCRWVAQAP